MRLTRRALAGFVGATAALGVVAGSLAVWAKDSPPAELHRSMDLAAAARARISVGMPLRDTADRLADAWHYADCRPHGRDLNLFLFGSHNLRDTGVVVLRAHGPPGEEVITSVGGEENYRLFLYDDCSTLDLSRTNEFSH